MDLGEDTIVVVVEGGIVQSVSCKGVLGNYVVVDIDDDSDDLIVVSSGLTIPIVSAWLRRTIKENGG